MQAVETVDDFIGVDLRLLLVILSLERWVVLLAGLNLRGVRETLWLFGREDLV
jgi:hypothetical protein